MYIKVTKNEVWQKMDEKERWLLDRYSKNPTQRSVGKLIKNIHKDKINV